MVAAAPPPAPAVAGRGLFSSPGIARSACSLPARHRWCKYAAPCPRPTRLDFRRFHLRISSGFTLNRSAIPPSVVAAAHPVTHQPPFRFRWRLRRRDDQFFPRVQRRIALQVVGIGDGRGRHSVFLADGHQRFSRFHAVPPPAHPLVRWNVRDLRGKFFRRPLRQVQFERRIVGSGQPQQRGIQPAQRFHVHVDRFRHQPQIDGPSRFHHIGRARELPGRPECYSAPRPWR